MTRRGLRPLVVGAALCLSAQAGQWGPAALAHHSIAGIYDESQRVRVEGVVTQFHFIDPHPFVVMQVKDDRGNAQRWKLEMDNRWELAELGFETQTLKPGDRIVVLGNLARRQPHSLYIRRLDRPSDGFSYEHHP